MLKPIREYQEVTVRWHDFDVNCRVRVGVFRETENDHYPVKIILSTYVDESAHFVSLNVGCGENDWERRLKKFDQHFCQTWFDLVQGTFGDSKPVNPFLGYTAQLQHQIAHQMRLQAESSHSVEQWLTALQQLNPAIKAYPSYPEEVIAALRTYLPSTN